MSRVKAFVIHLAISAAAALIVAVLALVLWYPPPYFHAAGADKLLLLLVGVNLSIGPLLTLVVYRAGKRGLGFDLVVIGLLQTAAFAYGFFVLAASRPVFLVSTMDRFVLVSAYQISQEDLAAGSTEPFRTLSWTGPRLAAAELPTDAKERSDLIDLALSGRDIQNLPKYYRSYASSSRNLLTKAQPLEQLRQKSLTEQYMVDAWLSKNHRARASVAWLPLQTRKNDLVMLLDAQTGEPLQALEIDPW